MGHAEAFARRDVPIAAVSNRSKAFPYSHLVGNIGGTI
jgi:hypothetical protein